MIRRRQARRVQKAQSQASSAPNIDSPQQSSLFGALPMGYTLIMDSATMSVFLDFRLLSVLGDLKVMIARRMVSTCPKRGNTPRTPLKSQGEHVIHNPNVVRGLDATFGDTSGTPTTCCLCTLLDEIGEECSLGEIVSNPLKEECFGIKLAYDERLVRVECVMGFCDFGTYSSRNQQVIG